MKLGPYFFLVDGEVQFLPAKVSRELAAKFLGMGIGDIAILCNRGLLKPLGHPSKNAPKWFSAVDLVRHYHDRVWLSKACKAISNFWAGKHRAGRKNGEAIMKISA